MAPWLGGGGDIVYAFLGCNAMSCYTLFGESPGRTFLVPYIKACFPKNKWVQKQWRLVQKILGGRKQTESTGDLVQAPWSFFFLHPNALWTGIFVKIKPNFHSSGDIALASTLISTCLSTDELLLRTVQSHEAKRIKTILICSNNKSGRSLRPKDNLKQAN